MNEPGVCEKGAWISLMDYAVKKGVSLSTLRRHIKANKMTYKVENGRYLVWNDDMGKPEKLENHPILQNSLHDLEKELRKAHEEIAELKMLIALYEEKTSLPTFSN